MFTPRTSSGAIVLPGIDPLRLMRPPGLRYSAFAEGFEPYRNTGAPRALAEAILDRYRQATGRWSTVRDQPRLSFVYNVDDGLVAQELRRFLGRLHAVGNTNWHAHLEQLLQPEVSICINWPRLPCYDLTVALLPRQICECDELTVCQCDPLGYCRQITSGHLLALWQDVESSPQMLAAAAHLEEATNLCLSFAEHREFQQVTDDNGLEVRSVDIEMRADTAEALAQALTWHFVGIATADAVRDCNRAFTEFVNAECRHLREFVFTSRYLIGHRMMSVN